MVCVGGVADDALVFLVERVHGPPGESDAIAQRRRVVGQADVLPGCPIDAPVAGSNREPGGIAQVTVPGRPVLGIEYAIAHIGP